MWQFASWLELIRSTPYIKTEKGQGQSVFKSKNISHRVWIIRVPIHYQQTIRTAVPSVSDAVVKGYKTREYTITSLEGV